MLQNLLVLTLVVGLHFALISPGCYTFGFMELSTAIKLLEKGVPQHNGKQVWLDLGAGKGLFTHALSTLLAAGSIVYALDTNEEALASIHADPLVTLKKLRQNFVSDEIETEIVDGVLMANAFHFVSDKVSCVQRLKKKIKSDGSIILVEYDSDTSNPWVPYPISFRNLVRFAETAGLTFIMKLEETPSLYGNGNIYSALLRF